MAKYMVLYTGGMGMAMEPEQQQKVMEEWGAWYGMMGEKIVDGGAPLGEAKHLAGNGVQDGSLNDTPTTGYTLIEEESLEAAAACCENHPHLNHGGQVQVYACIDMGGEG